MVYLQLCANIVFSEFISIDVEECKNQNDTG